ILSQQRGLLSPTVGQIKNPGGVSRRGFASARNLQKTGKVSRLRPMDAEEPLRMRNVSLKLTDRNRGGIARNDGINRRNFCDLLINGLLHIHVFNNTFEYHAAI